MAITFKEIVDEVPFYFWAAAMHSAAGSPTAITTKPRRNSRILEFAALKHGFFKELFL